MALKGLKQTPSVLAGEFNRRKENNAQVVFPHLHSSVEIATKSVHAYDKHIKCAVNSYSSLLHMQWISASLIHLSRDFGQLDIFLAMEFSRPLVYTIYFT